jgi:adenylosuccinate synthase
MAKTAWGIVGAGYGDEGKGVITDALAAALGAGVTVVRTNGGAQAGHSVELADGRRHVFHHLGAGTLAGAGTHLSRFFVSHPILLAEEVGAVRALGVEPRLSADPRGYVTTPWDMLVNQILERRRGGARHGSCGLGFGETVGRCEESGFPLTVADLAAPGLRRHLRAVRDGWARPRLAALGIADLSGEEESWLGSDAILERFVDDCSAYLDLIRIAPDSSLETAPQLVFEGAQGLMIDQDHGAFPYVTRSRTGLANMLDVAREAAVGRIDALYVHRCYVTRHGRGPMADERDVSADFDVVDPTNVPNPWQERLRFGLVDLEILAQAIARDVGLAKGRGIDVAASLAVTCLDQARGAIPYRRGGRLCRAPMPEFLDAASTETGLHCAAIASGPTRADVDLGHLLSDKLAA